MLLIDIVPVRTACAPGSGGAFSRRRLLAGHKEEIMSRILCPARVRLAAHRPAGGGGKFDLEQVDLREKDQEGRRLLEDQPKGQVPLLELDDGQMISEGPESKNTSPIRTLGLASSRPQAPSIAITSRAGSPISEPSCTRPTDPCFAERPQTSTRRFPGDAREQVQEHRQDARR